MTDASASTAGNGSLVSLEALWPVAALIGIMALGVLAPARVIEVNWIDFFVITVALGGGAAWLAGKAVAETWRPYALLLFYMVLLAAGVRFIHFALFHGTLLSLPFYLVDLVILAAVGSLGFRVARARQMTTQYSWLYERSGPLAWVRRGG
jgi:hypothetical protein